MNPVVKDWIVYTLVALGLICIARGVLGAEREGFKYALWMQLPGKPAEVRWLFDNKTSCMTDLASSANAAPKGTRFQCVRFASSGKRL